MERHLSRAAGHIACGNRMIAAVATGLVVSTLASCGISRTLEIRSEPVGAKVSIDGKERGVTPLETEVAWSDDESSNAHKRTITLTAPNCAVWERTLTFAEAEAARKKWTIDAKLDRLVHTMVVTIDSEPPGATVRMGGGSIFGTPARIPVTFRRDSADASWSTPRATVSLGDEYASRLLELDYDEVRRNPRVLVSMARLRQSVLVDITSNVEGATVTVDGQEIGTTPLKHRFTFSRSGADDQWNTYIISAHKEHYRYREPNKADDPYDASQYSRSIGLHHVQEGELHIELEPIEFYRTPVYRFAMHDETLGMEMRIEGSQIREIEREPAVYSVTHVPTRWVNGSFAETRLSVLPDDRTVVYSFPIHAREDASKTMANLCMQRGHEVIRLTDGYQLDLEATVSADGEWIYFASDRLRPGRLNLWRIRTAGRGGLTKITDSASSIADTEPAISPDGSRIAYTSYLEGANAPQIWLASADGSLPTQLRIGRQAAWSPDGSRIAYVAPDASGSEQIWIMNADGSSPTQLTSGEYTHQYPNWSPDGSRIVYACDQALNEAGMNQFDIWIMNADGSGKTQLTVNGSYDNRPVVSPSGRFVYFISNRGAQHDLDEAALQVWRLELEPESSQQADAKRTELMGPPAE